MWQRAVATIFEFFVVKEVERLSIPFCRWINKETKKERKTKTSSRTLMRTSPFCGGAMMTSVTSRGLLASHATAARHSIGYLFFGFSSFFLKVEEERKNQRTDRRLSVECSSIPFFSLSSFCPFAWPFQNFADQDRPCPQLSLLRFLLRRTKERERERERLGERE